MFDDEEVPVRSPIDVGEAPAVEPQDEEDFSTLLYLQKEFNRLMKELGSVDVFSLDNGQISVENQIIAYRKAKEILEPLQSLVNTRVDEIKHKQKGGK